MYRWERLTPGEVAGETVSEKETSEVVIRRIWPGDPNCGLEASRKSALDEKQRRLSKLERALFPR
jgi:hypothetical protein